MFLFAHKTWIHYERNTLNGAVGLLPCIVTTGFACVSVGRAIHLNTHRMNMYRSVVVGLYTCMSVYF